MAKDVLVVDDRPEMRRLLCMLLADAGYSVHEAGDGEQGLEQLQCHAVGLVISDLQMPRMDGIEFAKAFRANEKFHQAPILMLSATTDSAVINSAIGAGVNEWMTKPFTPTKLISAVRRLTGSLPSESRLDPLESE